MIIQLSGHSQNWFKFCSSPPARAHSPPRQPANYGSPISKEERDASLKQVYVKNKPPKSMKSPTRLPAPRSHPKFAGGPAATRNRQSPAPGASARPAPRFMQTAPAGTLVGQLLPHPSHPSRPDTSSLHRPSFDESGINQYPASRGNPGSSVGAAQPLVPMKTDLRAAYGGGMADLPRRSLLCSRGGNVGGGPPIHAHQHHHYHLFLPGSSPPGVAPGGGDRAGDLPRAAPNRNADGGLAAGVPALGGPPHIVYPMRPTSTPTSMKVGRL